MSGQSSGSSQYFASPSSLHIRRGMHSPSHSFSSSQTTSPSDYAPDCSITGEGSKNALTLANMVGYMAELPTLSEVKAACDCYADECGEFGTVSL